MQPAPPGSKLFHTIVVVGLSFAATACGGSMERASANADGAAPSPDGFPDATAPDAASQVAQTVTLGEAGPLAPGAAADASDSGDAGDEGDACMESCCRFPGAGTWSRVPCGTCPGPWPCYV
jgi:hypothetical protein